MFCHNCGAALADQSLFCGSCGTRTRASGVVAREEGPPRLAIEQAGGARGPRIRPNRVIERLVVGLLLVVALLTFFFPLMTLQIPVLGSQSVSGYDIFSKTRQTTSLASIAREGVNIDFNYILRSDYR